MVKEKPILFSGAMVRAILAGTKTVTRRVVKPRPTVTDNGCPRWGTYDGHRMYMVPRRAGGGSEVTMTDLIGEYCPYGRPGDRLWVREAWAVDAGLDQVRREREDVLSGIGYGPYYRADKVHENTGLTWRPSIHMPRWASRLTLEITAVRVERVQDISEADAKAEGVTLWNENQLTYRVGFAELWDDINDKRGYGWESNPWVWCISFRRLP